MICKNCNQEIPDDVAFCPNCGFSLKDPVEEAAAAVEETVEGSSEAAAEKLNAFNEHVAGIPAAVAKALGKAPEIVADETPEEVAQTVAESIAQTPEAYSEAVEEAVKVAEEVAHDLEAQRSEREQKFVDGINNMAAGVAAAAGAAGAAIASAADHAADFASDVAGDIADKVEKWDGPKLEWGSPTLEEAEKKAEAYGSGLMDEIPVPEAPEPPRPEGIPDPKPAPDPAPEQKAPEAPGTYAYDTAIPGRSQAVTSLVLGIVGTVGGVFLGFGFISAILGVIGVIMGNRAKQEGFEESIQKAGYILSIISIVIGALGFIACLACGAAIGLGAISGL